MTTGRSDESPSRENSSAYMFALRSWAGTPPWLARRLSGFRYSAPGRWPLRYVNTSVRTSTSVMPPSVCHLVSWSVDTRAGRGAPGDALSVGRVVLGAQDHPMTARMSHG